MRRLNTFLRSAALLLLALGGGAAAAAQPQRLRVCLSDVPHMPWRVGDKDGQVRRQGLDFELLRRVEQRTAWQLEPHVLPGKRCLAALQTGDVDAALGFSHSGDRAAMARYPMRHGLLDDSLALRVDSYSLYARSEQAASWDGQQLKLPAGSPAVAVQLGHAAADLLRGRRIAVNEGSRSAEQVLRLLQSGQADLAALLTSEAEALRRQHLSLASLRRLEPPLASRPYFVVFSHGFAAAQPQAMEALWRDFARAAQFPQYQAAVREARR
jgi:polar amino acid transport system substrate-binding protein